MAEVGGLFATLGIDTAQFQDGLSKAQNKLKDFDKATKGMGSGLTIFGNTAQQAGGRVENALEGIQRSAQRTANLLRAAFAAIAVQQLARFSLGIIDSVAEMGRLSQQTGISVDRLSALKFAVEQTGTEFEVLAQAAKGFSQRMLEGLRDPISNTSLALRALGSDMVEAARNSQNLADFLPALADRFARMPDGINKTQIAMAILGEEAGPRLIPFLNMGTGGIDQLMQRARELGVVLDQEAVEKAKKFNAALNELKAVLTGVATTFLLEATPALKDFMQTLTNGISTFGEWYRQSLGISTNLTALTARMDTLKQTIDTLNAKGFFSLTSKDREDLAYYRSELARVEENIRKVIAAEAARAANRDTIGPFTTETVPTPSITDMRNSVEAQRLQLDMFLQLANGSRTFQQSLGDLSNTQQMFGTTWLQGLEGLNIAEMDHATIVAQAQERIRQAYGDTAEAQQRLATVTQQLNLQYQQQVGQTAQKVGQALVDVFPKSKAAAAAQALVNTAVGVTQALTLPFPLNWIQAAAVAASGAAQLAAIKSASPGGSGTVPSPSGGAGGGGGSASAGQGQAPGILVVKGIDPSEIFTGQQLQDLMDRVSEAVRNGAVLQASSAGKVT